MVVALILKQTAILRFLTISDATRHATLIIIPVNKVTLQVIHFSVFLRSDSYRTSTLTVTKLDPRKCLRQSWSSSRD